MRAKGESTRARSPARTRILEAAEKLFSIGGYDGVPLRDIAREANVEVALVSYYFGPKQELFQHVIERRVQAHTDRVLAALDREIAACTNGRPTVERIIYAFSSATFELARRRDTGWKNYLQLVARSAVSPVNQPALKPLNHAYGLIVRRYVSAFRASLPTLDEADLYTAFYWLQAIISRMIAETGILDLQSRGLCRSGDYRAHLLRIVPFCSAGFYALAAGKASPQATGSSRVTKASGERQKSNVRRLNRAPRPLTRTPK